MTCEEAGALLSDYDEGILPLGLLTRLRLHLLVCPQCRALLATLRALPELLRRTFAVEEDFEARGREALQGALARLREPGTARIRPQDPPTPVSTEAPR